MNLLLNKLPDYLEIDGREYPIKTNFREWIRFEMVMMDANSSNEDKKYILHEIMNGVFKNAEKTIEQLILFYQCKRSEQNSKGSISTKRNYDYEYD